MDELARLREPEFGPALWPSHDWSNQWHQTTDSVPGPAVSWSCQPTIGSLFGLYRLAKAKRRSIGEIERIFNRYILPVFGHRTITTIDRPEISMFLDSIAAGRGRPTPVMARAVAAQLSAFYSWAMPRVSGLTHDPSRFAAKPDKPRPRTRILGDDELRVLWQVLGREPFPWSLGIKMILLTGQRRSEVFNASYGEFDLGQSVWTIPSTRVKNERKHRVPLSAVAMEVFRAIPGRGDTDNLFPARANPHNGASGFSKALARINRSVAAATGSTERFTLQDLRRTVATGMQRIGVRLEVTEAVLNHVSGSRDGIVGVYQLYQFEAEKRTALDAWAAELTRITA